MNPPDPSTFTVGRLVKVESRTWPGINKHGGIGRITRVLVATEALAPTSSTTDSEAPSTKTTTTVDVKYVLGGREKGIPIRYVHSADNYESTADRAPVASLRDRSMLLGRCKNCGALRADCGSCDWRFQQDGKTATVTARKPSSTKPAAATARQGLNQTKSQVRQRSVAEEEDSSSGSSDDSLLLPINHWKKRHDAKTLAFHKLEREMRRDSSDDSESSSSSSGEDELLSALRTSRSVRRNLALLSRLERATAPKKKNGKRKVVEKSQPSNSSKARTAATMNKNSERFVSRDCQTSEEDEALPTIDDDAIGDADMTQTFSPLRRRVTASPTEASIESSSEQIPRSLRQEGEESQVGVMLMENDLGGFIQPEGAATTLPRDSEDKTAKLAFAELPAFFDNTINHIHMVLPQAQASFADIQRRVETRKAVTGSFLSDLEKEGWDLYDSMKRDLLWDGLDQCRATFRRLNSRKEFKKNEPQLLNHQKRQFTESARSTRDIRFDQADQEVEEFLRETRRYLLYELKSSHDDDELYGEVNSSSEEEIQVYDEVDHRDVDPSKKQSYDERHSLPQFDPHMHASRVRRKNKRDRRWEKPVREKRRRGVSHRQHINMSCEESDLSFIVEPLSEKRKRRSKPEINTSFAKPSKSSSKRRNSHRTGPQDIYNVGESFHRPMNVENDSSVPALDALFARKATEASSRSSRASDISKNGISAGARMQAFLDANNPNGLEEFATNCSPRNRGPCGSQRALQGAKQQPSVETVSKPHQQITVPRRPTARDVFLTLASTQRSKPCATGCPSNKVISSLQVLRRCCQLLPQEDDLLRGVLEKIKLEENILFLSRHDTFAIFTLAHKYLLENARTLQELVVSGDSHLSRHAEVLAALLVLLENKANQQLEENDGVIFHLFTGSIPCPFVHSIILQLLDVLLAFFNPIGWAMESSLRADSIHNIFAPLRDALSSVAPLLEISSEYLCSQVQCQQWWKSQDGSKCFVSCVDPLSYKTLLETAKISKATNVRMKKFNSKMPRVEVDTLWSILGFLAGASVQISTPKSKGRWRLVYLLLCGETGVLPKALDGGGASSVCEAHIESCENELGNLAILVARGAMNPLDDTDKLIGLFLKRSILLQARSGGFSKFKDLFNLNEACLQKEFVLSQWEVSSLCSPLQAPDISEISKQCVATGLLGKVILLLESWVGQSENKRVLWSQLASSISKFLEIKGLNSNSDNDQASSNFANEFACSALDSIDFIREANIHVRVLFDVLRTDNAKQAKKPIITSDLIFKRWAQISNNEMKNMQRDLCARSITKDNIRGSDRSLVKSFTAIRTFGMYALAHLGLSIDLSSDLPRQSIQLADAQIHTGTKHEHVLHFSIGCIFASLTCMCTSISKHAGRSGWRSDDILKAIALSLGVVHRLCLSCRYIQTLNNDARSGHLQNEVKNVGRSIVELGGRALRDCLITVLSLAECKGAESCVRMCLATIRCATAWSAETKTKHQAPIVDDEFDDIDDSLFDSIGDSNERHDTAAEILSRAIRRLLDLGDPDKTFAIQPSVNADDDFSSIDSRGRILLCRFAGGLCCCLSSLVAASQVLLDAKEITFNCTMGNSASASYKRNWRFAFLSETCKLSEQHAPCRILVEQRYSEAVLSFLHMTLDAYTIERFPTCDLDTMMTLSGEQAARREGKQLNLAKDAAGGGIGIKRDEEIDEVGPVYVSNNLWQLYLCLAKITTGASPLCGFLTSFHYSAVIGIADGVVPASMELECLKRMRLLIGFFDARAATQAMKPFEDAALATINTMVLNIMQISEGLQYHSMHQARSTPQRRAVSSRKHGRLKILQSCYVEMFVTFLSSVILSNWTKFSDPFHASITSLREVCFFSVSQSGKNDIEGCFRRLLGTPIPTNVSRNKEVDSVMLDLSNGIKLACIRRCRETIRHHLACGSVADRQRGAISLVANISSFVNVANISIDNIIDIVANGLQTGIHSDLQGSTRRPLIECYVDAMHFGGREHLNSEAATVQKERENLGIRRLRNYLLTKVIPSRLMREKQTNNETKAPLIQLTNRLLHIQLDELKTTRLKVDDLFEMHSLLRASWEVIRQSLFFANGSADLIAQALRCVSLVVVLPFSPTANEPTQALIEWCRTFQGEYPEKYGPNTSSVPTLELFLEYLSTLVTIVHHIATTLLDNDPKVRRDHFDSILKSVAQSSCKVETISASSAAAFADNSLVSRLLWLNEKLLSAKGRCPTSKNIYLSNPKATQDAAKESLLLEPPARVKREAANFIAVVATAPLSFESRIEMTGHAALL